MGLLTPWLLMGGVAAYYMGHFMLGKEKMNTSQGDRIVQELERSLPATIVLGTDAEGDVTLDHVLTAIRGLGDKFREEQSVGRTLRRLHARTDHQRARAVIKVAEVEAEIRTCKESHERELKALREQLDVANKTLARREEAAQDFLKGQQANEERKKKKHGRRGA